MSEVIDLGAPKKFKIKMGADEFSINKPSALQVKAWADSMKAAEEGSEAEKFIEFLVSMGFPEASARVLDMDQIKLLTEALVGVNSEKK